jgi:hypothetical protein
MLSLSIPDKFNINYVLSFGNLRFDLNLTTIQGNMKEKESGIKKPSAKQGSSSETLQNKLATAIKNVEKAWEAYKKKAASYEKAVKEQTDKMGLKHLLSAAKVAKFTYKIKVVEHKLAKAIFKATHNAGNKSGKEAIKVPTKFKAIITKEDRLNSTAVNSKASVEVLKTKAEPKSKKKTAAKE